MPPTPRPDAIWIIDGHSQIFRAYYAIRSLSTADGLPTNAVFGFLQILQRLLATHAPTHLAVALDAAGTCFRNEFYPEYKAHRDETPADFGPQIPVIIDLLRAMHVPILSDARYEADDLIATLAAACRRADRQLVIVSSDKDLFQLVDDHVLMARLRPEQADVEFFDAAAVEAKLGIPPSRMVDYQALIGDPTDNIPGVPGIGPKSAVELLRQFPSLEELLARSSEIEKKRWRTLVEQHAEQARLSYRLARLVDDAPLAVEVPDDLARREPDVAALAALYRRLEFHSFLRDLVGADAAAVDPDAPPAPANAYHVVADRAALDRLAARLREAGHFAFDTETTGTDTLLSEMVGLSVSPAPHESYYVPVAHDGFDATTVGQLDLATVREVLGPLFAAAAPTKSAHNAKFDIEVLHTAGFEVAGLSHDTMILAHLTDSERSSLGLKQLAQAVLGVAMQPISELIGTGKSQITFAQVAIADAAPYACADADLTLRLERDLAPRLDPGGAIDRLYRDVEMPLIDVLVRMEEHGVGVDLSYLGELRARFEERLGGIRREVAAIVGDEINLSSPKQVGELLFTKLGLPVVKRTKTGPSTDVTVLEELAPQHPVPGLLLQHRLYEKLLGTYVVALPKLVNPRTGRIHASFHQVGASTGRLSCSDPNLQNIPIRTEEGRLIRRAFVPAVEGNVLLSADYSQIELRLLAHASGDASLIEAFRAGGDIHRLTASKIYGVAESDVTREQRGAGKTINFGIIYGMGAFRLANDLAIDRKTAQQFIDDYFRGYPGAAAWIERQKELARAQGYVETLRGRRRRLPDIGARDNNARQAAERVATNAPLQGTAADLIKEAMVALDRRLVRELPACRLLLQVHDELVLECPAALAGEAERLVREEMEGVGRDLAVPLLVEAATGPNWADCK